ncbi:FAD-dependent oxidoreductase [Ruania alkalisoli]|uniref:FAD-dependent oxidoreductase n=1 Tax=Ruania alkalisoli TaxID=2779775 RepID=A0A7M1SV67_9MICO|nr:FAD-dependent oxidoreductase [Ruania alkalisoli]QOR71438.1 FAD-dependent oxidoreductase [Ruania alkalisoli]
MTAGMVRTDDYHVDVAVIGGGLAGVCAAIAAARQGADVALVQNRPVLGGNSSSEVRVWVCGATAHGVHHFARETGIMGELFVENQFTNPEGNPYYWDLVLLEAVRAEPRIQLFLNTDVTDVEASGPDDARRIHAVTGWQSGSERRVRVSAGAFVDATGDGLVGYLAGAWYRLGREAREVYGESWAPEVEDGATLGSTILFYSTDAGRPVKFVPPSFAVDIMKTAIPELRPISVEAKGCRYWWIEWGGELDVVADNERIRDELQGVVYGIWDYIKNSGRFDADSLTLEWIGSVPGKREYRRFEGGYTLTQHDVLDQTVFDDRVAFGGWSIDLHPPGGVYATEKGSRHWHPDGNYHIPLRCLYSANVTNMWMGGRNISASHVAFGSVRVMATCGLTGEAAGLGAAVALAEGVSPAELATQRFDVMRRALIRSDASVLGLVHEDPADLALQASVDVSSTWDRVEETGAVSGSYPLTNHLGILVPVAPAIDGVQVQVDASRDTELVAELWRTGAPHVYLPKQQVAVERVGVPQGKGGWVRLPLAWRPKTECNAVIVLRANPDVTVCLQDEPIPGVATIGHKPLPDGEAMPEIWRYWRQALEHHVPRLRLDAPTAAYAPRRAVGGYARPYAGPQMWVSAPFAEDPEPWLQLTWHAPADVGEVTIVFDDDVQEDLVNLHRHRTPFEVLPTLVRDYRVEVVPEGADEWQVVAEVTGNRVRHRRHELSRRVTRLRVVVSATNGVQSARIVSVRAWATAGQQ